MANGTAYAAWTDTRAGNQNIEFASFPIDPPPAPLTDRFDPDSSPATATNLGSVIRTSLPQLAVAGGDQDWFRFQAAATGVLTVQANAGLAGSVPTLELVDASGSTVLASGVDQFDAQGRLIGEQIEFAGVAGQTYLVHLTPSGSSGDVSYSLDVQSLTADLGTQVQADAGGMLAPGDQAYDLISAGVSGSMEVSLVAAADLQGSLQLEVLDPDTLAVLATGSGQDGTEQASVVVTQGQALLVHVFGTATTTGHYLLDMVNLDQYETPDNASLLFPAGAGPSEVALADLTGNGIMDAVVTNALSNTVSVLLGNGDGTFQAPRQYAVGSFIAGGPDSLAGLPNFGAQWSSRTSPATASPTSWSPTTTRATSRYFWAGATARSSRSAALTRPPVHSRLPWVISPATASKISWSRIRSPAQPATSPCSSARGWDIPAGTTDFRAWERPGQPDRHRRRESRRHSRLDRREHGGARNSGLPGPR